MTKETILIKVVDQAVANGWLGIQDLGYRFDGVSLLHGAIRINTSLLDRKSWLFNHYTQIIFSEDFSEAFFGKAHHHWVSLVHCSNCGVNYDSTDTQCCWQYHFSQLLLTPHPLRYLEGFL